MKTETNSNSGASAETICPRCGSTEHRTAVRQYENMPHVVDVGWKCTKCGHEWGFEAGGEAREP